MYGNNGTLRRVVCTARARVPTELVVIDQETEAVTVRRDGSAISKPEPAVAARNPLMPAVWRCIEIGARHCSDASTRCAASNVQRLAEMPTRNASGS